jgi:acyl dehydratase
MIAADKLAALATKPREVSYDNKLGLLYALGTGFGQDPMNTAELPFVFEKGQRVSPSMASIIGVDGTIYGEADLNLVKVVHGEQRLVLHRPLPVSGTVVVTTRISAAQDKGKDKGAIVVAETEVVDKKDGKPLFTNQSTTFARGDGGTGANFGAVIPPHALPTRTPDAVVERKTQANQALFYRLCGDYNPLHAEPAFATAAGFPKPILHGLCTYGFTCRAVLEAMAGYDAAKIADFAARFSAPVYPGETIRTEMWRDGDVVSFRSLVTERDIVVLNNGKATLLG